MFAKTFPEVRGMLTRNKTFTVSSIPQIIDLAFYDIKSVEIRTPVSYTHLTLPTNREV